jgi:hypothetical protein
VNIGKEKMMKQIVLLLMVGVVAFCGCGIQEKAKRATNKAGQVVGEGASSFFSGVGEGVDKTITDYDVRLSSELKELGLSTTIAKRVSTKGEDALSFYILNKSPVSGRLRLKMFNEKGDEIGRSTEEIIFEADDARYVQFGLDKEIPLMMVQYVELDLKLEKPQQKPEGDVQKAAPQD